MVILHSKDSTYLQGKSSDFQMLMTFQWSFEMKREWILKTQQMTLHPSGCSCQCLNFYTAIAARQNTFVVVFQSEFKLSI